MAEFLGVLTVTVMLVGAAVAMHVRESAAQSRPRGVRVREPRTRTFVYAIPEDLDPAVLRLGLERAGFHSEIARSGGGRHLLVTSKTTERAALRGVIEAACVTAYAGPEPHREHVVFEDER